MVGLVWLEIVHYVDNHPIAEGTKVTGALVGATVIQPNLVEYQGKKALVFVFAVRFISLFSASCRPFGSMFTPPRFFCCFFLLQMSGIVRTVQRAHCDLPAHM